MKLFGINVGVQKLLFPEENGGESLLKKQLSPIVGDVGYFNLVNMLNGVECPRG